MALMNQRQQLPKPTDAKKKMQRWRLINRQRQRLDDQPSDGLDDRQADVQVDSHAADWQH